jgi:SAM-dependent methyltransferase
VANLDTKNLRCEVSKQYAEVAQNPQRGFHFHTGRKLVNLLGYTNLWPDAWIDSISAGSIESFAGTGNPFAVAEIKPGEQVVDVGSGAGFDSLIAGRLVGAGGKVIGVDMTPEMLNKARSSANELMLNQVEFRTGNAESLPVPDEWADVVISNGVVNLCPDKLAVFKEMFRVLKPGGRIQIGDIAVSKPVPESAKDNVDLWTG